MSSLKHGHIIGRKKSGTYETWGGMLQRCNNPNHSAFDYYGGKGVKVCDRWLTFENFLADMGDRPPGMTLDRINSDGHYEPSNCRWADRATQTRNRSQTVWIEYEGLRMCIRDWADEVGIPHKTLDSRINKLGWSVERALTTPVRRPARRAS